ncbi:MAG: TetR/AcrR family transcriptional regulator [Mycobacteriales bacterium]
MPRNSGSAARPARPPTAGSGIARRRAAAKDESNPAYVERRREIVAAAARVFKAKGLQGTRLGDIAAESGADRASLYYYVGSKEELFQEVVREAVLANVTAARHIRDGGGTAPEKLRELIVSLISSYAEHYPILYVFVQENLTHVPDKHLRWAAEMRAVNQEYERIVVGLVEQGMQDATLRPVAPAWVIAYGLIGMMGWTSRWFDPHESPASAAEIARAFADTLLHGVATAAPDPAVA